ncbi:Putative uncharacterized protein [Paenibacillus sp. P22]|nr:Putative uncharacterized protein [Paenibacillus sp. P22]
MGRHSAFWVVLVIVLTACSAGSGEGKPADSAPGGKLSLINMSLYRSDSAKAQPELILVQSDPDKLAAAGKWIRSGESRALPPAESISKIYGLQFQYPTKTSTESVDYILLTDDQSSYYLKQVEPRQIADLDSFDSEDKESILEKAGKEGWFSVSSPEFFN